MLIDTHTHLYASEFAADRADVIDRAMEAGVLQFVLPAIDSETTEAMHALKRDYPNTMHLMMGLLLIMIKSALTVKTSCFSIREDNF